MTSPKFNLAWIIVSDLEKAEKFFVGKIGLKLHSKSEEWGWMEFKGDDGAIIGVAQHKPENPMPPGSNAVITLTVPDLEKSKQELSAKGINFIGETMEVPGHVKLQFFSDDDGNSYQLVELLDT